MPVSRADVVDTDFVDAPELKSSGTTVNVTTTVVSTVSSSKTINLNFAADGEGFLYGRDHQVEPEDIVTLSGTTGGADGTYTIAAIPTDLSVTVAEAIADSTGGTATFKFPAGALSVGIDPTGFTQTIATNVQKALKDIDAAVGSGGITEAQHKALRQLIHLADGGGPFEGFASGAYREVTGTAFPSAIVWWESSAKLKKVVEKLISYTGAFPNQIVWKVYDATGTLLVTATDAITYSGAFETNRTRTLS